MRISDLSSDVCSADLIEQRDDVSRVTPGVFGETANRTRVFFVESVSGDSSAVQNIFVSSVHGSTSGVSMSRSGHTETAANGTRFIVRSERRRVGKEWAGTVRSREPPNPEKKKN